MMKTLWLPLCVMAAVILAGTFYARAQVVQEPPPTEPPIEQIDPALRGLSDVVPWETLAQTLFTRKKFHDDDFDVDYFVEMPDFPPAVRVFDNTTVTIAGYMVVYEKADSHESFLLTGLPMNIEGDYDGPGSLVVEVHPAAPEPPYQGIVRYTGRLELVPGAKDAKGIYYRLQDAVKAP